MRSSVESSLFISLAKTTEFTHSHLPLQVQAHEHSANTTLAQYWTQVESLLRQMDGIYDGYRSATAALQPLAREQVRSLARQRDAWDPAAASTEKALLPQQVAILSYAADLEDLVNAIPYINGTDHAPPLPGADGAHKGARTPRERMMDCSALVKLDPENKGLWTGHTTFNAYWCMLRVFKVSTDRKTKAIACESEPPGASAPVL